MHIEPGVLAAAKIAVANLAAIGVVASAGAALLPRPALLVRAALAAAFFTLCMESFFVKVGPSELHFIGAMPMALALGFVPTLLGFAAGLLLQGLLFEPADLLHLGVNTLSLAVPLLVVYAAWGRRAMRGGAKIDLATVVRLDAAYYAGVTLMVGFWLSIGEVATPLADWLLFAASYLAVVALEPILTIVVLLGVARLRRAPAAAGIAALCFDGRVALRR